MIKNQTDRIRRACRNGFSVTEICNLYGLTRSEVQRAIGVKRGVTRQQEIKQRAIAELRAEGHDDRVIAACFGGMA